MNEVYEDERINVLFQMDDTQPIFNFMVLKDADLSLCDTYTNPCALLIQNIPSTEQEEAVVESLRTDDELVSEVKDEDGFLYTKIATWSQSKSITSTEQAILCGWFVHNASYGILHANMRSWDSLEGFADIVTRCEDRLNALRNTLEFQTPEYVALFAKVKQEAANSSPKICMTISAEEYALMMRLVDHYLRFLWWFAAVPNMRNVVNAEVLKEQRQVVSSHLLQSNPSLFGGDAELVTAIVSEFYDDKVKLLYCNLQLASLKRKHEEEYERDKEDKYEWYDLDTERAKQII